MAEEGGCRVGGVPEVVGVERRKIRLRAAANCTATPWVALTAAAAPPGGQVRTTTNHFTIILHE
uniref:Uncharacterized protein n=1 Tax=Cucumis melo TaxID=3656 RepID=A0A9I9E0R7_CUCME